MRPPGPKLMMTYIDDLADTIEDVTAALERTPWWRVFRRRELNAMLDDAYTQLKGATKQSFSER